ncbi:hypothetical protein CAEBREN_00851 [Caenorhabditis brenneri]|uniref:F-box domain-containing protein n=1 Tax=Caenorhabditis brenneri TaxID=135651 RepID=G0N307_CAEBE|nr:hypothetical protein CAEBREN_00851 [Caenorhabditis brenneri]
MSAENLVLIEFHCPAGAQFPNFPVELKNLPSKMPESLKNDDKSIRSYILNNVLEKVPIDKSYENLRKVMGNDAITFYDFQFWYYRFLSGKQDLDFDRSSEPEPLQFSDLPVDAVGLIVNKLEVVERLMLRKVSKPLREFIEKQEIACTFIYVSCGNDLIFVLYGNELILYAKNEEAVKMFEDFFYFYVRKPLFIYSDYFESEAFNDLAWILKNPKVQIELLDLSNMLPCSGDKVPIDKSYENLCKVIGNDAIAFYDFQFWYYRFLSGKQDLDFDRSSEAEPVQFSDLPVDVVRLIVDKLEVVERSVDGNLLDFESEALTDHFFQINAQKSVETTARIHRETSIRLHMHQRQLRIQNFNLVNSRFRLWIRVTKMKYSRRSSQS